MEAVMLHRNEQKAIPNDLLIQELSWCG